MLRGMVFVVYFFVKPSMALLLCSYTRLIKFDVTPVQRVPFRLLKRMYTYPFFVLPMFFALSWDSGLLSLRGAQRRSNLLMHCHCEERYRACRERSMAEAIHFIAGFVAIG